MDFVLTLTNRVSVKEDAKKKLAKTDTNNVHVLSLAMLLTRSVDRLKFNVTSLAMEGGWGMWEVLQQTSKKSHGS